MTTDISPFVRFRDAIDGEGWPEQKTSGYVIAHKDIDPLVDCLVTQGPPVGYILEELAAHAKEPLGPQPIDGCWYIEEPEDEIWQWAGNIPSMVVLTVALMRTIVEAMGDSILQQLYILYNTNLREQPLGEYIEELEADLAQRDLRDRTETTLQE